VVLTYAVGERLGEGEEERIKREGVRERGRKGKLIGWGFITLFYHSRQRKNGNPNNIAD